MSQQQQQQEFTIVLKKTTNIKEQAEHMALQHPNDRQYAEPTDFAALSFSRVQEYLDNALNAKVIRKNERAGVITFVADGDKVRQLFPLRNDKDFMISPYLQDYIASVHGPGQTLKLKHHFTKSRETNPLSYFANQVGKYYGFPSPTISTGVGQVIAILEFGGDFTAADISKAFSLANVPVPTVKYVSVDGTQNTPGKDPDSDGEVALDIQIAGQNAPGSTIVVYFAANSEQGFIEAFNYAVHDTVNKPDILSISWGGPENSWSANGLQSINTTCQAASLLGITILAASGDDGSSDGESGINADFPASSPYVTACGATSLTTTPESGWNSDGGSSGGGVSSVFPIPTWQAKANIPKTPSGSPIVGFAGNGVPTIAADGDPNSGYTVVIDGQVADGVGGTSCVGPLMAGFVAQANQINKKNVGFVNPLLFANPSALKPILSGNNGFYKCGPGWNGVCGLGAPIGASLVQVLAGTFTPPPPGVTANNASETVTENTAFDFAISAITTVAGATITSFNVLTNPANGTLSFPGTQPTPDSISVVYTPKTGYTGPDLFTFSAKDSTGLTSNIATVSINVKASAPAGAMIRLQAMNAGQWVTLFQGNA